MAAGGCHAAAAAGDPSSTSQFGFTFGSTSCRPNALQGLTFVLSSPNVARLESTKRAREVSEAPEDIMPVPRASLARRRPPRRPVVLQVSHHTLSHFVTRLPSSRVVD